MPRPALSPEEELLKIFSQGASESEREELKAVVKNKLSSDERALEAEAVLLYFDLKGAGFVKQKCPECDKTFAYKYTIASISSKQVKKDKQEIAVAYKKYAGTFRCSNECRRDGLAKRGIEWTPGKSPEERWGMQGQSKGTIPLIVPPAALEILESKLLETHDDNSYSVS